MMIDIRPATTRMVDLLAAVSESQFDLPTPCPEARLGDLIDHIGALTGGSPRSPARKPVAVARRHDRAPPISKRPGRTGSRVISRRWPRRGETPRRGRARPSPAGSSCQVKSLDSSHSTSWSCMVGTSLSRSGRRTSPPPTTSRRPPRSLHPSALPATAICSARLSPFRPAPHRWTGLGLTGRDPNWQPSTG